MATGKHAGEQKEYRVSRYTEQTEQRAKKVPGFCWLWQHTAETQPGTGTQEPVLGMAGHSKASGIKEKEPLYSGPVCENFSVKHLHMTPKPEV